MKRKQSIKQQLYQVNVETTAGAVHPVGPVTIRAVCDQLASEIRKQVALGRERNWHNPHVVPVLNLN